MQSSQNHIIDKVFLEVNTTDENTANKIKNSVSSFLNLEVFPKLEQLFDRYDFNNQVFRIDSLDIDFSVQDWDRPDEIKYEFLNNIQQKIEETLSKNNKDFIYNNYNTDDGITFDRPLQQLVNKEQNYQTTFLFFLENGFLPWFGKQEYIEEVSSVIQWTKNLEQIQFFSDLTELFRSNSAATERFILQFPNKQIFSYIEFVGIINIKPELLNYTKGLSPRTRYEFLNLLLKISLNTSEYKALFVEFAEQQLLKKDFSKITNQMVVDWNLDFLSGIQHCFTDKTKLKYFKLTKEEIPHILKEINFAGTHLGVESEEFAKANLENKPTIFLQDFVNSKREKEPAYFEKDRNEIILQNAGLVLFHPFLNAYFSQFNWIDNKGEIKTEHRFEAVQALHYCATGDENFFEGNLLLEKFLCGVPLAVPIPFDSLLNEQVKLEADAMAAQLINYWTALKNTSPAGLREMFINRKGKLVQKEKGFKLIVERKVQDILLDKLQWNISIVKLPWRKELLYVDW